MYHLDAGELIKLFVSQLVIVKIGTFFVKMGDCDFGTLKTVNSVIFMLYKITK